MATDLLRTLLLAAIASSAAMLLVLALRKPMRRKFGAHAAYALWSLMPLSALAALLPAPAASLSTRIVLMDVTGAVAATSAHSPPAIHPFDPSPWPVAVWLLGVGSVGLLFVNQQRRFVRGLGRLSTFGDDILLAQTTAGCPALLGAWYPRVVLPADFRQRYNATERELILAHERSHRARGDAQINALTAVLRCAFWFNPLIHFVASRFRFDQELACDASVISRFPEARRPYADAMLKTQLAEFGLPVGCHWQSSHPLKERIVMLKQPLPGRARAALGAGAALALIIIGSYAAWAAQPSAPITAAGAPKAAALGAGEEKAGYRQLSRIDYPAQAIAAKIEGVVYVKAHIASDGSVTAASVDRIAPPTASILADAAVAGVKTWTFDPAQQRGKPVATDEIVPIVFALEGEAMPATRTPVAAAASAALRISGATLEAIRISPPEADSPKPKPSDLPPTEDVSFRRSDPPKYPQAALDAHQSAKVTLKVLVDETGSPASAEIVTVDPPQNEKLFANASVAAAMQWRYNPGTRDGKPHAGYVFVPITFALDDHD